MPQGGITRQTIESLPRRQQQPRRVQAADTFVPAQEAPGESRASRIVQALHNFTDTAMDVAVTEQKKKIELDKVTQQQRALRGLAPTDDATEAGIRAYQVINMRDEVLRANAELGDWVRQNPDADDEEYEIASREVYADILNKYEADPELSHAASNRIQEAQVQTHQIREAAARDHRQFQAQEKFGQVIENYREAAQTPQEFLASIEEGGSVYNEGRAIGVTDQQQRVMLIQMAQLDASTGDGRILQALEKTEWAGRDPRVAKARETFDTVNAQENSVAIGSRLGEIQMGWKTRSASWEQTQAALQQLEQDYPGFNASPAMVASLKQQGIQAQQQDTIVSELLQDGLANRGNPDWVPPTQDPRYAQYSGAIASQGAELIQQQTERQAALGEIAEEDVPHVIMQRQLDFGRWFNVDMPGVEAVVNNVRHLTPEDVTGEGAFDARTESALRSISLMNDEDIQRYGANEENRELFRNYQALRASDEPDGRAWATALSYARGESRLSAEEQSDLIDGIESEVDSAFGRAIFQGRWSSMSDSAKTFFRSEARRLAKTHVGAGAIDKDRTIQAVVSEIESRHTLIGKDSWATARPQAIASQTQVNPSDHTDMFAWYFENNRDNLVEVAADADLELDNVWFHVAPNGSLQVRDTGTNNPLASGIRLSDLGEEFREAVRERRVSEVLDARRLRSERSRIQEETRDDPSEKTAPAPGQVTEGSGFGGF